MLAQLLNQARRRIVAQLALDKGALALTIGLGGFILLLIIGTQVLNWYWPVLLIAVSLGIGLYQLRKFIPSTYTLAQRIDRKLELADALSTAVHFSDHPRDGAEAVCRLQHREAESLASGVDLKAALPYRRSRYLIPALGLLMVAAGMFAVRYAVTGSLDLQPSLIEMAIDTFFDSPAEETPKLPLRADMRPEFFDPNNPDAPPPLEELTEMPIETNESSALTKGDSDEETKSEDKGDSADKGKEGDDPQEPADDQKGRDPNNKKDDKQGDGKEGDQDSPQDSKQEERSMLDKLRDAVSNLMNKMNSNESKQNKQQKGNKQQQASKDKQQSGEKGDDKAERAEGQPQTDQNQKGDQNDKQQADAQQAPGERPSEDAAAGAGMQDGEKKAEQAKMLEAMGKMSQLLGQRALEVSGQMMVEVGNTKQQLRTQWTQQNAGHAEAGSEIHRDEIPLMYQPFVERYFEEVRKGTQPVPSKAKPAADAKPPVAGKQQQN